jgi:integrase/recombinase XerC
MINNTDAFADYLLKEKNYSPLTLRAYLDDVRGFEQFIQKDDTGATLVEVNYSQVRSWVVFLVEEGGLSNRSVNRKIASLKAFYRFLLKAKQIDYSLQPAAKTQSPKNRKESAGSF